MRSSPQPAESGNLDRYPTDYNDTGFGPFTPLFSERSKRVWGHVQVLLAGAIRAPGRPYTKSR